MSFVYIFENQNHYREATLNDNLYIKVVAHQILIRSLVTLNVHKKDPLWGSIVGWLLHNFRFEFDFFSFYPDHFYGRGTLYIKIRLTLPLSTYRQRYNILILMYSWVYGVDDFMENLLEMNIKMSYSVKTYWKVKSELEKYGCGSVWSWTRSDIRKNRQELLDPYPTLEKKTQIRIRHNKIHP